jgi:hypothetical protein
LWVFVLFGKFVYLCGMKKEGYNIKITHTEMGEILNETFIDRTQFKLFLKMVHGCIELKNDLSFFDGDTFLVHIPIKVLKDCVIVTLVKELTITEQVKSKIEALVTR